MAESVINLLELMKQTMVASRNKYLELLRNNEELSGGVLSYNNGIKKYLLDKHYLGERIIFSLTKRTDPTFATNYLIEFTYTHGDEKIEFTLELQKERAHSIERKEMIGILRRHHESIKDPRRKFFEAKTRLFPADTSYAVMTLITKGVKTGCRRYSIDLSNYTGQLECSPLQAKLNEINAVKNDLYYFIRNHALVSQEERLLEKLKNLDHEAEQIKTNRLFEGTELF